MITVPPGRVTLSDRRTQRSWSVDLADYRISAVPVTQELYARVVGQHPSTATGDRWPVEGVSWHDAIRFCDASSRSEGLAPAYRVSLAADGAESVEVDENADGYRLPTEAEWEDTRRASVRRRSHLTFRIDDVGFRVARSRAS